MLWREINAVYYNSRIPLGGKPLTTELNIKPLWYAMGLSTDKPERFQGFHSENLLLIVDEASGVSQQIYDAAEGALTSENARLLLIGNPTQLAGEFYTAFKSPLYHKIHISYQDTPNFHAETVTRPYLITPAWVEEKRVHWGEGTPLWQSRVEGEFPEQGDDTLIPLPWIEAAQQRYAANAPAIIEHLGVDVARYGSDSSVIVSRGGRRAEIYKMLRKRSTMELAGAVVNALDETNAIRAYIDEIGVGGGVVDRLKEQNKPVVGVNVADNAKDGDRYINLRAEGYWNLREHFQAGTIDIPPDDRLSGELSNIKYAFDSKGRYKIESKEDMKARGLSSPDIADALMLAFLPAALLDQPSKLVRVGWN